MKAAKNSAILLRRMRVDAPEHFRLASVDSGDTGGLDKKEAEALLADDLKRLADLQQRLYADGHWAVLVVLQAMDAAGKDGVISHVMTGLNPQGVSVHAFKAPSPDELNHDFLWRVVKRLPPRGSFGIFNRSYYEEVLVVRVRPELLGHEKLPPPLVTKEIWEERFESIRTFERHLERSGVIVLKFFLHISKKEQRERFLDRLQDPSKRWKFSMGDVGDRKLWDRYMAAYQDMVRATSREGAHWHVVPADHKWFARLAVARTIVEALERLDLKFPTIEGKARKELEKVRMSLLAEEPGGKDKASANREGKGERR